jgi:hypothetical protein
VLPGQVHVGHHAYHYNYHDDDIYYHLDDYDNYDDYNGCSDNNHTSAATQ